MSKDRVWKCSIRDGLFVEPCSALEEATMFGNSRGKQRGIYAQALWSRATDKHARTYYVVKSGDYIVGGIILNFCPFCGERIDAPALAGAGEKAETKP